MKITLESTDRMVEVNGIPARVWEGTTERGVPMFALIAHALIARVAVHKSEDNSQFEAELTEHKPASDTALRVFPLRMIL
jgi:hypothetical protein